MSPLGGACNVALVSRIRRCAALLAPACLLAISAALSGCGAPAPESAWDPDSVADAFAQPSGALMWPGLARSFLVDSGGALLNGLWSVQFTPSAGGTPAGPPPRIASEERWLPVLRWNRASGDVHWRFEAVGRPARSDSDSVLAVSLRVRVVNSGSAEQRVKLEARLDSMPQPPRFVAPDGDTPPPRVLAWNGVAARDSCCGWSEAGGAGAVTTFEATLRAGEQRELRFVLPSHPLPRADLDACARIAHTRRVANVRAFWSGAIAHGTRFELGDPDVERALSAATVVLLACRERWGGNWYPIGGPFQYRDTWIRDGARLIQALAITNHLAEARACAAGLATLQWPQGPFLTQRGQLDGTGQALWAFEQAGLRPAPAPEIGGFARQAMLACRWGEWQRELGRGAGWPYGRMLPFADPHDGELTEAPLVGNDLWMLAGYRAAARLCGAAGRKQDSTTIEAWRAVYATDFADALTRRGSRDVPPCWQGEGRDWGNLTAAWPAQVLAPGDPRVERMARRVWRTVGGAGLLSYGDPDSLQTYVGADLGVWAMLADQPATADSVLAAVLAWRNASGAGAELFSRAHRDYGWNLPPHPTSAAALVALVRNALVFDDGDTLMLTLGARDRWWSGAKVSGAPTRWGMLDLSFRREGDHAHWSWSAVPVWTALRVPRGTRVAEAPAPLVREPGGHRVLAPPGAASADVRLEAEDAGR